MDDNQSIYDYLFSSEEMLEKGNLTEREAGILRAKIKGIYTLLDREGEMECR